ncbi:hypothetical protein MTR_2g059915 [Medicago truncatula]|uniref:Uncharacterized protein n=1 Tax=Medicago truncatula TaxID=3880 RepID=A0A072V8U5_MEDTR|nr:hypothetical protein MTR_2g059915 [Medicago truncatula]
MVCHQQQLQRFDDDNVNLTIQLRESTPPLIIRQGKSTPPLIEQQCKGTPPPINDNQTNNIRKLTSIPTTFVFTPKTNSVPINTSLHFKFGQSCAEILKNSL